MVTYNFINWLKFENIYIYIYIYIVRIVLKNIQNLICIKTIPNNARDITQLKIDDYLKIAIVCVY